VSNPAQPSRFGPAALIATWFGSGLLPGMPGTWGSLAALICAWPLIAWGGAVALPVATVAVFILGCWAAARYEAQSGRKDPGEVVVDEVAGQWIALLPLVLWPWGDDAMIAAALGSFLLFRLFDIWKPWPIGVFDRELSGGLGIMVDDVLAGLYAALCLVLGAMIITFLRWGEAAPSITEM
jgi:phosphatidylglycerophosphatase A